jgi:hypothetical protein
MNQRRNFLKIKNTWNKKNGTKYIRPFGHSKADLRGISMAINDCMK